MYKVIVSCKNTQEDNRMFFLSETKAVNGTAFSSNSEVGQGNVYSAGNAKADENKESTKVVLNEDFTPIWEHKDIENLVAGVYSTDGELIENWDSLIASDKLIIEEHGGVRCLFCNDTNIGPVLVVDEDSFFYKSFGKEEFNKERIVVNK